MRKVDFQGQHHLGAETQVAGFGWREAEVGKDIATACS